MAYYQEDPSSDLPQNWEEYHEQYGNKPGQPGWDNLSDPEKGWIKGGRSPYQGFTEQEEQMMGEWWRRVEEGSPADISGLEDLMERYQMSPGIRQYLIKRVQKLLTGGPDYQDVYAAQKGKLDVAMRGQERGLMGRQAARGLLGTSETQARLGALQGAYSGTLADLLMGTAEMTARTRATRRAQGLGLMQAGLGWQESDISRKGQLEELRNMLYAQDLGLRETGIRYLGEERGRENIYNLGLAGLPQDDPLMGIEVLQSLLPPLGSAIFGSMGGVGDYGGGGGGESPAGDWYEDPMDLFGD